VPERTAYAEGVPSYCDLMSTDPDASKRFYGALFGWDFDDVPTPQGPIYSMCKLRGKEVAGIGPLPPDMAEAGMPPMWNSYVTVDDVDATAASVADAGGTVMMPPMDVMDAGRMAGIMDPTGAAIMIWQAKDSIGAQLVNENGTLTWNELITPDVDAAAAFYEKLFGWKAQTDDMGGGMNYTSFLLDGQPVGGAMKPPMEGMPPFWGVYFAVDDCDGTVATAKEAGATIVVEPNDIPPGRMAVITDPIGATFSVLQLAQPAS
jgi:predicted enzyme related to lactoylglutathione lyase